MGWETILIVAAISFGIFFLVALGMAIGVIFGRRPISGSCGGLGQRKGADGKSACSLCENPAEACQEIRERQERASVASDRRETASAEH